LLETPETKWTSVDIQKIVPAKDRNDNPQWELTVRWEWTPINNSWGEKIWVYRESAPSAIEEGRQNVLVEKGNVKNNREGTPYDGTFEWMYRYKIVGWEQLQGTFAGPNKSQPSQPSQPEEAVNGTLITEGTNPEPLQEAPVEVIPENQMRIMRQSTLHYAAILTSCMAPVDKKLASPQVMVERTIDLSGKLLDYVISGEMPTFGDPEEHDDLLDHEV